MRVLNTLRMLNIKAKWVFTFLILNACVEQIYFDIPPAEFQTVVEGMISDSPGPYTVFVSKGISLDADSSYRAPLSNVKVTLFDDEGNSEDFTETTPGVYKSAGIMEGQVGHSYILRLETADGKRFESEPERINPVGEISDIRYEFEARTVVEPFGEVNADVFNIYVDADAGSGTENYIRWKFTGTYKVLTYPELHYAWNPPYTPYKDPWPCSGYILVGGPIGSGGLLEKVGECTCCTCWVSQYETEPQLSDEQLVSGGQFKNIKVGEVPINNATFHEKFLVQVEQMSLSRSSFEFFKLVRSQKEGASSLFQPPSGEIRGNIKAMNSNDAVIGIFWATSTRTSSRFIYPSDVPYPVTTIDYLTLPCYEFYPNATSTKPATWE